MEAPAGRPGSAGRRVCRAQWLRPCHSIWSRLPQFRATSSLLGVCCPCVTLGGGFLTPNLRASVAGGHRPDARGSRRFSAPFAGVSLRHLPQWEFRNGGFGTRSLLSRCGRPWGNHSYRASPITRRLLHSFEIPLEWGQSSTLCSGKHLRSPLVMSRAEIGKAAPRGLRIKNFDKYRPAVV